MLPISLTWFRFPRQDIFAASLAHFRRNRSLSEGIWWFGFNSGCCFLFRFNLAYKFLKESFRGDVVFAKKFFKKFFEISFKKFFGIS